MQFPSVRDEEQVQSPALSNQASRGLLLRQQNAESVIEQKRLIVASAPHSGKDCAQY
jgi:hypothetical protein